MQFIKITSIYIKKYASQIYVHVVYYYCKRMESRYCVVISKKERGQLSANFAHF